jgi:hypothetical protein
MPGKHAAKPHVQQYLNKRGVNADQVPDEVIAALNDCTPEELQAMEKVGASMEAAKMDPSLRVSLMH